MTTTPRLAPGSASRARGQASVELALTLPLVAVAMLLVVQVLLVARAQVLVEHAAREAGRTAAVDPDPATARAAALAGGLDPARTTVHIDRHQPVRVVAVVRTRFRTDVPIVGALVADLDLDASATFRAEGAPP